MSTIFHRAWYMLQRPPTILKLGHPLLRLKAQPVSKTTLHTPEFLAIVKDMETAFYSPLHQIVGLAAPQVGHSLRLIAYRGNLKYDPPVSISSLSSSSSSSTSSSSSSSSSSSGGGGGSNNNSIQFIVNPKIDSLTNNDTHTAYEACESIPNYDGLVRRYKNIRVSGMNLSGETVKISAAGFLARVLQHEMDHLDGVLYTDRLERNGLRHESLIDVYDVSSSIKSSSSVKSTRSPASTTITAS